ncbi:RDD family protein [Candidatus Solincola tengchongensis]|uniref:RDD family protein n=1 Tax=Candidatus Solincola tengchongensis TaxID=2900693 RepID=UPI00257E34BA|nr:RDD family protein [Candidatus Solincola tengchongensis]
MRTCPACGLLNAEEANFCSGCGFRLSGVMPPATSYPVPPVAEAAYPRYAGFWIRFVAAFIDGLVLSVIYLPVNFIFWAANENIYFWGTWDFSRGVSFGLLFLYNLIRMLIGWAYYTYLTGRYGATLGKRLLGLRVVGEDLQPVTFGTAAVREIPGKLISALFCMFGYIWAGFDGRKQAWHDKIARTLVIYG